eukprot:31346-Pelagococcus_subviridis.AAC.20
MLKPNDDGELLRDDGRGRGRRVVASRRSQRGLGEAHRALAQVRRPYRPPVLSQRGDARRGRGELADRRELVRASREELVRVARGVAVPRPAPRPRPPPGLLLLGAFLLLLLLLVVVVALAVVAAAAVVVVRSDRVQVHVHRIDEPDVLHAERLRGADDGAVVVLVRAPLDDDEDAARPSLNRGLRLAQEAVREPRGVRVVWVVVPRVHDGARAE